MNLELNTYIIMFTICAAASSLLTEAIKVTAKNAGKEWSSNIIAFIDAVIVGGGVPVVYYIFNDIPFTLKNIITIVCFVILTWIGSTIGFDKVKQTIMQILNIKGKEDTTDK